MTGESNVTDRQDGDPLKDILDIMDIHIVPTDPAFNLGESEDSDANLPSIYLFSNSPSGDGAAYSMAEDGTVLGSHWCSHWGYMRHDLHDRPDRKKDCEAHYPDGYNLVVLTAPRQLPPQIVLDRNKQQGEQAK